MITATQVIVITYLFLWCTVGHFLAVPWKNQTNGTAMAYDGANWQNSQEYV